MANKKKTNGAARLNPLDTVKIWLDGAISARIKDPNLMALATADKQGRSSSRIIRIVDFRSSGIVFLTHETSLKGKQISATGWSSGVIYWPKLGQQIIISGPTDILPDKESDFFWDTRSKRSHPVSSLSLQSAPLKNEAKLRLEAQELLNLDQALPRPDRFKAYIIKPQTLELWSTDPIGLHNRMFFTRDETHWRVEQLYP